MNFLRSAISSIHKNFTIELHSLRQNRLFCTAKSSFSETKSNEDNHIASKGTSISERNDDEVTNDKNKTLEKEDAIQSNIESGILISSYNTVGTIQI